MSYFEVSYFGAGRVNWGQTHRVVGFGNLAGADVGGRHLFCGGVGHLAPPLLVRFVDTVVGVDKGRPATCLLPMTSHVITPHVT